MKDNKTHPNKKTRLLLILWIVFCIAGLGILMISGADVIEIMGIGISLIAAIIFGLFGYVHHEVLDFKNRGNLGGKITWKELKAESNYFFWGSLYLLLTTLDGLILFLSIIAIIGTTISLIWAVPIVLAIIFVYLFIRTCINYLQVRNVQKKIND